MTLSSWFAMIGCAVISTLADTMATLYWESRRPLHLFATLGLAPLVFVLFGYVGAKQGLATASGLTNSLIVAGPILVGLVLRREAQHLSSLQLVGLLLIFTGIGMVVLFGRDVV